MKVEYVTDTSEWEKWQCDYRFGLILIIPPEPIFTQINSLRKKYDPSSHATCPAHITLSDPLGMEMTSDKDAEISGILSSVQPFTLYIDSPQASKKRGGVTCPIRPHEAIFTLRSALCAASVFCHPPYYTRKIPPHMTIAEFVTIEESWRILGEVENMAPNVSFVCDRLEFVVPDTNMHRDIRKSCGSGLSFGG